MQFCLPQANVMCSSLHFMVRASNSFHCCLHTKNRSLFYLYNIKRSSGSVMWGHGMDRAGSEQGQVAGTCDCGNEPSGSIK